MIELELLAPARDVETAIVAINSGADAVYIGADHHGARAAAENSVEEIRRLCQYAHRFGVKVYVTVNTLIYDDELSDVRDLIKQLYSAGADALIVQDMAVLEMDIPPIELHASTQCDTRTPEKAAFLEAVGFDQIVLPREMTLYEIKAVRAVTTVPLEGFVHGALCVSYSGDCRASLVNGGRSANRGQCAQICRLPYTLVDGEGKVLSANRHLLSLRDLNRIADLAKMADAGISSFKIEGRLKSADYVRNVVAAYSMALDEVVKANPTVYRRASFGSADIGFKPEVSKSFNRGFTNYFLTDEQPAKGTMASILTPKHIGSPIGKIKHADSRQITLEQPFPLNNGDGLGFFDKNSEFVGFRLNRSDGKKLFLGADLQVVPSPGTLLYRNFDKAFADGLNRRRSVRKIDVRMVLDKTNRGICLTVTDERGCEATGAIDVEISPARSAQENARQKILEKTGETIYRVTKVTDNLGEIFIPASLLTELRRHTLDILDHTAAATRPLGLRSRTSSDVPFPKKRLDMHDNVANKLARKFYEAHGAVIDSPALETDLDKGAGDVTVMTTRYCLRRELGICLKTPEGKSVKGPLKLINSDNRTRPMRLEFDCKNCRMNVIAEARF